MMGTFTVLTKSLTFKTPFNREKNGFSIYAFLITCIIYCNTFCTKLLTLENVNKINSHGLYIFLHILKTRAKLSIQSGL